MADDTNNQLKKNVYQNYSQFIETAKEISHLESDMYRYGCLSCVLPVDRFVGRDIPILLEESDYINQACIFSFDLFCWCQKTKK